MRAARRGGAEAAIKPYGPTRKRCIIFALAGAYWLLLNYKVLGELKGEGGGQVSALAGEGGLKTRGSQQAF